MNKDQFIYSTYRSKQQHHRFHIVTLSSWPLVVIVAAFSLDILVKVVSNTCVNKRHAGITIDTPLNYQKLENKKHHKDRVLLVCKPFYK